MTGNDLYLEILTPPPGPGARVVPEDEMESIARSLHDSLSADVGDLHSEPLVLESVEGFFSYQLLASHT